MSNSENFIGLIITAAVCEAIKHTSEYLYDELLRQDNYVSNMSNSEETVIAFGITKNMIMKCLLVPFEYLIFKYFGRPIRLEN